MLAMYPGIAVPLTVRRIEHQGLEMSKHSNNQVSVSAHVALLIVEFFIPHATSLKDKRRVVKSMKDRIANRYNISVAEIACLEEWQHAVLGIVMIGNERRHVEQSLAGLRDWLQEMRDINLADMSMEWL